MLDKMKAMIQMQKKIQELKRQLENTYFETVSSDGVVKIVMSAAQEVKEVSISREMQGLEKADLEKALKDVYNKAIKRCQDIASDKMKEVSGLDIPGLT